MQRIRRFRQNHPLADLALGALRGAQRLYSEFDTARRISRVSHNINNMAPTGSRSRSRSNNRMQSIQGRTGPTPRRSRSRGRSRRRSRSGSSRRSTSGRRSSRTSSIVSMRSNPRYPSAVHASNRVSGGGFGKGYAKKVSKFYGASGVVSKQEWGNTISDPQAIYIGHGIPTNYLVSHLARNIVKKLYVKGGIEPRDWADSPPFDAAEQHQIQFEYYVFPASTTGTLATTTTFVTGNTYNDIVFKVELIMRSIQQGAPTSAVRWGIATLFAINAGQRYMKSQVNLQRVHMDFEFISQLKVQNVTEASTGAGANDDLVTNVEANPLIGKHYFRKDWKNGFDLHWRPGSQVDWTGFYANQTTGIIESTALDANATSGYRETFNKPPPYFAFNSTKGDAVQMQPGEIKTSFIKFKTHIMWQNMYDKIYRSFLGDETIYPIEFGLSKLLGLEKLLDSRLASDANVTIQFEVMQQFKSTMVEIKQSTLPHVQIL